jgi:Flp pilus assembly protein TadB
MGRIKQRKTRGLKTKMEQTKTNEKNEEKDGRRNETKNQLSQAKSSQGLWWSDPNLPSLFMLFGRGGAELLLGRASGTGEVALALISLLMTAALFVASLLMAFASALTAANVAVLNTHFVAVLVVLLGGRAVLKTLVRAFFLLLLRVSLVFLGFISVHGEGEKIR